jgi:Rod binding domain-containing protein
MGTIGLGLPTAQTDVLQSRESGLIQQMQATLPSDDAKIEKGSKDFEAMLLGSWLQQAEQSFATVPGAEDDGEDQQRDQIMSFGVQALAGAIEADGGLGIAKMIAHAMHEAAAQQQHQKTNPGTAVGVEGKEPGK